MSDNLIELTEGDNNIAHTLTVKRGGSTVDLTSAFDGAAMYVHDDEAAAGTNKIDGVACTNLAADGTCTFTFTSTHTTLVGTDTDFRGTWCLKMTQAAGSITEYTKQEPIIIKRNPFVA